MIAKIKTVLIVLSFALNAVLGIVLLTAIADEPKPPPRHIWNNEKIVKGVIDASNSDVVTIIDSTTDIEQRENALWQRIVDAAGM